MDEGTAELLSRYLDGDLDTAETHLIEARLAAEPDLLAELAALRRLQLQVRSVADRMMPPAALDAPPRPADRGAPRTSGRVPPAVRWLGLAAGVALAVTVAVEVVRGPASLQAPALQATPATAPAATPPQPPAPQALEPLATEGMEELREADASRPAGSPSPAPPASLKRPPPPEQEAPAATEHKQAMGEKTRGPAIPTESLAGAEIAHADRTGKPQSNDTVAPAEAVPARERGEAAATDELAAFAGPAAGLAAPEESGGGARLVLTGEGGAAVAELALPAASPDLGVTLIVTVTDGVIVSVEPEAAGTAVSSAVDELIGRPLPGLADGRYLGTVVADGAVP